ncbi:hypothetical protein HCN44_003312 [Aphidius gifuensis]|uniref:Odorant receptor n=1 Tax=Aphidius gifuensis TaxID=684658 RepID=A0A834XLH4_APHGI|nr:uncharacterized protein LOC122859007 [Aphidius gifuensis]KAF7987550.1 hypothetical protein HCN44_003312 [Aphidius gifuensis]
MFCIKSIFLLLIIIKNTSAVLIKCCDDNYYLNDNFKCIKSQKNNTVTFDNITDGTESSFKPCIYDFIGQSSEEKMCMGILKNETIIKVSCFVVHGVTENIQCDSLLTVLNFWGAKMVIFATIFYTIPYLILIIVYVVYSDLRIRAYDKSVLSFSVYYFVINCCLVTLGLFETCHKILPAYVYGIFGLVFIFLVQQTCMWLFAICFDITLVITRFQWAPGNDDSKKRNEIKKFRTYTVIILAVSLIPTVITAVFEFIPILPNDSFFKPNFSNFHGKRKTSQLIYTFTVPVLMLLANTILFIYTTYKMFKVQKDTKFLNKNNVKQAKSKYWVYLKLYLIMDTPWISGTLSAIYPSLWMLKFVRMIQPLLVLYVTLPKKRVIQAIGCKKKVLNKSPSIRMIQLTDKKSLKQLNDNELGLTKPLNINEDDK